MSDNLPAVVDGQDGGGLPAAVEHHEATGYDLPATGGFESDPAAVERVFAKLDEAFPNDADNLRAEWGALAGWWMDKAQTFIDANPDMAEYVEAEGLGAFPPILKLAALMGARYHGASAQQRTDGMETIPGYDNGAQQLDDVRRQIHEAQAEGNNRKANALYQLEQQIITSTRGNSPVVGAGGRRV